MHGKIFLNRGCLQFLVIFSFLISPSFGQNAPTTPRTQQVTTTSPATPTIATRTSTSSRTSPTGSTTIRSTSTNATTSPSSNRTTAASLTTISLSTTRPSATNATTFSVTSRTSVTSSMSVSLSTTPSTTNATTPSSANRTSTAFTTSVATSTARSTGSNSTTLSPQNRTSTVSANSTLPSTVTTIATAATGPSSTTLRSVSVTASNHANFSTTTPARNTSSPTSNSTTTTSSSFTTFSSGNFSSSSASLTTLKNTQSTNASLASTVPPFATASSTSSTSRAASSVANSGTTTSKVNAVSDGTSSMLPTTPAVDSISPLVPQLTATDQVTIPTVSDAAVLASEMVLSTETPTLIAPELTGSTVPETTSQLPSLDATPSSTSATMDSSDFTTKVNNQLSEAPSLQITALSAPEQTVDLSTTISNSNGASGLIEHVTTTDMTATSDDITESDASASDSGTTAESDETPEFTDVTDSSTFETDSTVAGDPGMEGMSDNQLEAFETDLVQAIIPVTKDVTDALEVFNGIFVGEIIPLGGVVSNVTGKKLEETIRKWRLFRSFLDTLDEDPTSSAETDLTRGINFTPEDGELYELSNFVTQTSHDTGTLKSAWAVIDGFLVSWKHLHHLTLAANGIIEQKVTEMKKAINKATEKLEAMNRTLQDIYKYKERLAETERDMSVKSSLRFIKLKEVHREIQQMKSYNKEAESIYNTMLALQTRGDNQEKKQEDNANYDEKHQQLHSILESKQHAFFAQRTSSCSQRDTLTLKTKQGGCGTSRLSIQIVQTSPTSRVLAGIQMDSSDWFGWFPLQLQAPANLVVNDQIGVKLSEGCIYGNGSVDHLTTNFGGFVIAIL